MPTYSHVVSIPSTLDERAIDTFVGSLHDLGASRRVMIDARKVRWVGPAGLVALFVVGAWLRGRGMSRPGLLPPDSEYVRSYWARMRAGRYASDYFYGHETLREPSSSGSGQLIPLTRLPEPDLTDADLHLRDLPDRTLELLRGLGHTPQKALGTAVSVVEVAAEMLEGAGASVWISAQTYNWRSKLGRLVVSLAIGSHAYSPRLDPSLADRGFPSGTRDLLALESLLLHGASRFRDPDDTAGAFTRLRRAVDRANGAMTVRAGTARISVVPSWSDDEPAASGLPSFPGTLVTIAVPAPER